MPEQQNIPESLPETCASRDGIVAGGSRVVSIASAFSLAERAAAALSQKHHITEQEEAPTLNADIGIPSYRYPGWTVRRGWKQRMPACPSVCRPVSRLMLGLASFSSTDPFPCAATARHERKPTRSLTHPRSFCSYRMMRNANQARSTCT